MVKFDQILFTIKYQDKRNVTAIKIIYNEGQKYRSEQRGPRSKIQHLKKLIKRDEYVYWFKRLEIQDVVRDILWSHPDSIKFLNSFPTFLICDTTYKRNKYCLLLLEIVGVIFIDMNFSVAFAYL